MEVTELTPEWRREIESKGREVVAHLLPEIGTLWLHPSWQNPDFHGTWIVEQVGGEAGEFNEAIVLRRLGGRRKTVKVGVLLWPSGWVAAEQPSVLLSP